MKARTRLLRITLAVLVLATAADVAMAQLPGPFEFSFFSGSLNRIFLFPFRLAGCG